MAADDPKFTCTACGKEYRWKPELAGRKAKCGCGAALVVPAERPGGAAPAVAQPAAVATHAVQPAPAPRGVPAATLREDPPPAAQSPDLKPAIVAATTGGAKCPACGVALAPNAVLCVNCGYNLKTGQTLSVVVERDEEDDDELEAEASSKTPAASSAGKPAKSAKPAP